MIRKCIKCGRVICEGKAAFYKSPLKDMCNYHRDEELKKLSSQEDKKAEEEK